MRYWLIMPAAGIGSRFGQAVPKQYIPVHGRTVIEWSLAPFLADSRCAGVVVALASGDSFWPAIAAGLSAPDRARLSAATRRVPAPPSANVVVTAAVGGSHRSTSVRNGLAALQQRAKPDDWVLVHDAARPCVPPEDVDRLVSRLESHPVGGLLAAPAADTLKCAGEGGQVARTVDRSDLWRALTPQMFRYGRLCEALDCAAAAGRTPTDESQAIEWLGDQPVLVEGSAANIKITSAEDLLLAAALLSAGVERLQ
jgi:2-C-methyl-D-erythritol 4-phosphate cytidylyltransferase